MKSRTVVISFEMETADSTNAIKKYIRDGVEYDFDSEAKQLEVNVIQATKAKKAKSRKRARK